MPGVSTLAKAISRGRKLYRTTSRLPSGKKLLPGRVNPRTTIEAHSQFEPRGIYTATNPEDLGPLVHGGEYEDVVASLRTGKMDDYCELEDYYDYNKVLSRKERLKDTLLYLGRKPKITTIRALKGQEPRVIDASTQKKFDELLKGFTAYKGRGHFTRWLRKRGDAILMGDYVADAPHIQQLVILNPGKFSAKLGKQWKVLALPAALKIADEMFPEAAEAK